MWRERGLGLSRSILVVEDNASLRRLITEALRQHGFHVLPAARAARGQHIVDRERGQIALAILDMVMPGMSGLDLAAYLGRAFPSIPILYISGHGESLAIQSIARLSPANVLLKPFTADRLVERVIRLIGEENRAPSRAAPGPPAAS